MSEAILATDATQLVVAAAALIGGTLNPASTTVVLVSPDEAAEVQTELVQAARVLAERHGLRLVHLNEVLAPFHPLGWRGADVRPARVRAAWAEAGGLAPVDVLYCFGSSNPAQRGLVRVLGATRSRIVDSSRVAGVKLRRRSGRGLILGAGPGLVFLCRIRRVGTGLIRARRTAQVAAELAALGVVAPKVPRVITIWRPGLWRGFLGGPLPKAPARRARRKSPSAPDSDDSLLAFVRGCVERIDADRHSGSGDPIG